LLKGDLAGQEQRGEGEFRLLVRTSTRNQTGTLAAPGSAGGSVRSIDGPEPATTNPRQSRGLTDQHSASGRGQVCADDREQIRTADAVIDASGTYGQPNWLGDGGIPAVGERAAAEHIEYGLADILGHQRDRYAGRHVLVVGAGHSAATSVVALAELARSEPSTRVTWVTRRAASGEGPVRQIANDRLPLRDELARRANALAAEGALVRHLPGTRVDALAGGAEGFLVRLVGEHAGELAVDRLIANVGYRPDNRLWAELQVDECYASGGPRTMAAASLSQAVGDETTVPPVYSPGAKDQGFVVRVDARPCGPETLVCPEPDFYVLGAKSYGRGSQFLYSMGLAQIRALFTILHDGA
jgi:thioredoxin reductase